MYDARHNQIHLFEKLEQQIFCLFEYDLGNFDSKKIAPACHIHVFFSSFGFLQLQSVCHLCFFYSLMHAAAPWCETGFGVLKSAGVSDMPAWVVTDGGFFSSTRRGFKRLLQKWSTTWQGSSSFISDRTSMHIWILDKWPISCLWNNRWWEMKDAFPFWLKALKLNKRN